MGLNKALLIGNVGRAPEMKDVGETKMVKFSLATSDHRFKDEDGKPRTEWHNIVAWGKTAEFVEKYIDKGREIYVEGQIRTRSWEQDGERKYMTEVHADQIQFVGKRETQQADTGGY